ncbi:MAG: hypothetical protein GXO71_03990 [Caldiserica bacterium]|nr:hypothetical protein [Caldisericota bacterium]
MSRFTLFIKDLQGLKADKLAWALLPWKKLTLLEKNRILATGLLFENLHEEKALYWKEKIGERGVEVEMVSEEEINALPQPIEVFQGKVKENELLLNSEKETFHIPYENFLYLACARVRRKEQTEKKIFNPEHRVVVTKYGAVGVGGWEKKVEEVSEWSYLLSLVSGDPLLHLQVFEKSFAFPSLGLPLKLTRFDNMLQFLEYISNRGENMLVDDSVKFIMDGNPLTNLKLFSPEDFQERVNRGIFKALGRI